MHGLCTAGRPTLGAFTGGRNGAGRGGRKAEAPVRPDCSRLQPLSAELVAYFAGRGISRATLERNGVLQDRAGTIAFPYRRDGEVVNVKYRTLDKKFWQARGPPLPFARRCAPHLPCVACECGLRLVAHTARGTEACVE